MTPKPKLPIQPGDTVFITISGQIVQAEVRAIKHFLWFRAYLCQWTVNDYGFKYPEAKWKWRVWK